MKISKNLKSVMLAPIILATSAIAVSFPLSTFAIVQSIVGKNPGGLTITQLDSGALDIKTLISNIASFSAALIAAVAVVFVIYAAYLYLTSAGDPAKVTDASKYILWAIIASVVALSAFGIIALGKAIFGFSGPAGP